MTVVMNLRRYYPFNKLSFDDKCPFDEMVINEVSDPTLRLYRVLIVVSKLSGLRQF